MHFDIANLFTSGFVGVGKSWTNTAYDFYKKYVGPPSENKKKYDNNGAKYYGLFY